ncbi:hypothetical protein [uncultured Shimia sp.]|uniref:hypothetical protein n=1 Tax=uncultured Shimia sp. TaxID=573152 RepID=UPI00261983D6|nr:hypothetical protein [uncultured Shimia sp.]
MILIIKRFLTALPVSLLLSTGSYAACERIDQPSSHPALEQAKAHLSIGQIEAAVAQLDMPDSVRPQLIQEFSKALSAGVVECIIARRVRQAERFMGELIVFVTENGFL